MKREEYIDGLTMGEVEDIIVDYIDPKDLNKVLDLLREKARGTYAAQLKKSQKVFPLHKGHGCQLCGRLFCSGNCFK